MIAAVGVVVPARNEQDRILACLGSLRRALQRLPTGTAAAVTVVLDSCTDRTPDRVATMIAAWPQAEAVLTRDTLPGASTNVRAGTEIKVTTENPSVSLRLTEMDKGSWVIFQLPGFNTAASGTQQTSLDALRKASDTSYFKDNDALWVKVVSNGTGADAGGPGGGTSLQVSR